MLGIDRDPLSNTNPELINTYIDTLKDPYDNGIYQAANAFLEFVKNIDDEIDIDGFSDTRLKCRERHM